MCMYIHIKGRDDPVSDKIAHRESDSVQAPKFKTGDSVLQWAADKTKGAAPEKIIRKGEGRKDIMILLTDTRMITWTKG